MYDMYTSGRYPFTRSEALQHFSVIDREVSMNFHPCHGSMLPITAGEAERLLARWGTPKAKALMREMAPTSGAKQ